jgi:DNA-damage-inducible protein D
MESSSELDKLKKTSKRGSFYWNARQIQPLLGYAEWENFAKVVEKAIAACERAGVGASNHFLETTEKVALGSGATGKRATYLISRHGCYLVAMNGDPTKPEIALAQTYFAVQTRRQEIADQQALEQTEQERLELRDQLTDATKGLNSAAKTSGVQHYGLFHDAGYRGLYGMGLSDIKTRKGIKQAEKLFDRAGSSELAANFFRATQTRDRLQKLNTKGEQGAKNVHQQVGAEIRATIERMGNKMPEDLPAEPPIKTLRLKSKKQLRAPKE